MTDKKPYLVITNNDRKLGLVSHEETEIVDIDDENVNMLSFENITILVPMDILLGKALMYMQAKERKSSDPLPTNVFGE